MANKETDIDVKKVLKDFQTAYEAKKKWLKSAEEDYEFALGKQWDNADVDDLNERGIRALTINKIRPNIFLLNGLESQNRSDYRAFPEGGEDTIVAEICTQLLKNTMKITNADYRISEMFEHGLMCGESYLEPYLDYTYDMVNGKLCFKRADYTKIFPDPAFDNYDLTDAEFVCKLTTDLSKDKLVQLFPDRESLIDGLGVTNIDLQGFSNIRTLTGEDVQRHGYNADDDESQGDAPTEKTYDLLEYYYKKYVRKIYIAKKGVGIKAVDTDEQADQAIAVDQQTDTSGGRYPMKKISRLEPEIWCFSVVGNTEMDNARAWSYPKWKSFPLIPYYVYRTKARIRDTEYQVQGLVRMLKDPQRELNKRRTQELVILNTSANSGWIAEDKTLVDEENWKEYASSSGFIGKWKKVDPSSQPPQRIMPTPLSQGHAQLAAENSEDMKAISGINTDLLAMSDKTSSGVAINIRQRQGLVMVQKIFDNLSQSKKILGRFIVAMFSEVYDVETVMKVLGNAFIKANFAVPQMKQQINVQSGQPEQVPITDQNGQMVMQIDQGTLMQTLNNVLNNSQLGMYDVAIGESANNETVKYANYLTIMDMAKSGIPIPPEVLVGESLLNSANKDKIIKAIETQRSTAPQKTMA